MGRARKYLIFEDVRENLVLRPVFDACVNMVMDGSARISKTREEPGYPQYPCFRFEGAEVLVGDVLRYFLFELAVAGFNCERAIDFSERLRKLTGFSHEFRFTLEQWVNRCLRDPYFYDKNDGKDRLRQEWALKPDEAHDFIPEGFYRFACYIAVCLMKYGPSYASSAANEIFGFVTALGSDLPKKMKRHGSGDLPRDVTEYKDAEVSCYANDAFATVKIALKAESEENYAKVLGFLCRLLEHDFPRSYAIAFRSPEKNFLPVGGLPKKGVHQLFANAARYPALYGEIENYARLAMREYEWYNDLEGENCAMPGTFAVFALGLCDIMFAPLLCDYLELCDEEHSGIQGKFIPVYIEKFGFTADTLSVFITAADSMQELPHHKAYAAAAADGEILRSLLAAKKDCGKNKWQAVLYALWGDDAIRAKGAKTVKAAAPALKPLYEKIFGD
ncbi:MAG: DUF6138 family protein [Synergistaceae bacterium]|jgi:hypothetical protein|nr:DUF6138 family protein [Synergistaceae bacterium]